MLRKSDCRNSHISQRPECSFRLGYQTEETTGLWSVYFIFNMLARAQQRETLGVFSETEDSTTENPATDLVTVEQKKHKLQVEVDFYMCILS